jgi:hypothetical protein
MRLTISAVEVIVFVVVVVAVISSQKGRRGRGRFFGTLAAALALHVVSEIGKTTK